MNQERQDFKRQLCHDKRPCARVPDWNWKDVRVTNGGNRGGNKDGSWAW